MHVLNRFLVQRRFTPMLSVQIAWRLAVPQRPEALHSYTIVWTSVSSAIIGSLRVEIGVLECQYQRRSWDDRLTLHFPQP